MKLSVDRPPRRSSPLLPFARHPLPSAARPFNRPSESANLLICSLHQRICSAICITMVHILPCTRSVPSDPNPRAKQVRNSPHAVTSRAILAMGVGRSPQADDPMSNTALKPALHTNPRGNALTGPSCTAGRREFIGHSMLRYALSTSRRISVE